MKVKVISLLMLILSLALTSCSFPGSKNSGVIIDWVDFIMLNDIQYIRNYEEDSNYVENSVDGIVGKVKFNVSSNVKDTGYKVKDGDAAFLPKGTKIYKIKGYNLEFRIAVSIEGKWYIYEADSNPNANKGEDLIDIRDKVSYIGINSETDGTTELGAIKDKTEIDKMVNMVLNAEVNQNSQNHDGQRYFIAFHLQDGSSVTRCYWIESGELSRGILLPDEFGIGVENALTKK